MEVANLLAELEVLLDHVRRDARTMADPKGAVLLDTSAEVLTGIKSAFEHYESSRK